MSNRRKNGLHTVERLNASNLSEVEKLYTIVYNKQVVPGYFAKKYNTAFTGIVYTGYMAYNPQGAPIAFYAVIPCFIKCGGEIILVAQSADTMTHPDHRNKGLFIELALTTFQLCRDLNIRLLFGFPNQNSLPGFVNKLDWQVAHTMDCFIIHAGSFPFKTIMGKIPLLNKLYTKYQQHTLSHYFSKQTGISNSVFENGYGGIYRDESYLKYKAYGNTSVLQTGNSLLWIKFSEILLIGDILVQPDDFDDMIYTLKKLARKLGIRQIHFHTSPGTTLHGLFAMRFNSIPSFPVIFKVLGDDLQTGKIKFTSADIDTF